MNIQICGVIVFLLVIIDICSGDNEKYTSKYDNIDVDEILKSERLLRNYMNCLLDIGRCTLDGQELKKNLPDMTETGCSKCTKKQKEIGTKVLKYLIENKKDYFNELEIKYDPEKRYKKRYRENLKKQGINI
ncbi:hypothetical protein ABEB36_009514 [Hypothenemus hampei]|uniref:Uncharacterized protein n=1 Tax=Hypothenemus hampei TaxID=57062 RepID=A0ABD1EGP5_HYPHA